MKKISSLAFVALALTACGGGSDKDNNSPAPNAVVQGSMLKYNNDSKLIGGNGISRSGANAVKSLVVDGKEYPLFVAGMKVENNGATLAHEEVDKAAQKAIYRWLQPNMTHASAGVLTLGTGLDRDGNSINDTSYLFYQGTTPTNFPGRGTARYEGTAAISSDFNDSGARATFDVDFGAKTLRGQLDNRVEISDSQHLNGLNFTGTIQGTTFSGQNGSTQYTGGFYGPNAEELAGILRDEQRSLYGYYGAQKK